MHLNLCMGKSNVDIKPICCIVSCDYCSVCAVHQIRILFRANMFNISGESVLEY